MQGNLIDSREYMRELYPPQPSFVDSTFNTLVKYVNCEELYVVHKFFASMESSFTSSLRLVLVTCIGRLCMGIRRPVPQREPVCTRPVPWSKTIPALPPMILSISIWVC